MYKEHDRFNVEMKVKRIVFSDPATLFRIVQVYILSQKGENGIDPYLKGQETIHMTIPLIEEGDVMRATVVVKRSERYGYALSLIEDYEVVTPQNEKELERFLIRKVKGVGTKTARSLIKAYGMDVMSVIEKDDNAFSNIGISKGRGEKIRESLEGHQSFNRLASFLFSMNLPLSIAVAIYDSLGVDSLNQVQQNPYLIASFERVSFTHADIIAHALKKDSRSVHRVKAGIVALIEEHMSNGDMCVEESVVYQKLEYFLNVKGNYQSYENSRITMELIKQAITELGKSQVVVKDRDKSSRTYLYLKDMYSTENYIVRALKKLMTDFRPLLATPEQVEETLVANQALNLAPLQRQAVTMALNSPLSILTGGPGTGKTHTVNAIVQILKQLKPDAKIALLAPTGKAAKRMSEMTKMSAMTIHRKLNLSGFGSTEGTTPIEEDFVIVDEVSMVDAELFKALVANVSETTRILLVGDVDQLPSIGPGLILKDLIQSKRIPLTMLKEVFRQAQDSQIVMNAHRLIKGLDTQDEDGLSIDHTKGDMYFVESTEKSHLKRLIIRSIERQMEAHNRKIDDICVLSPMRVGDLGTIALNQDIQALVNPQDGTKGEMVYKRDYAMTFREGDRVINLVNNVDKDVMNGETGFITKIATFIHTDDNGRTVSKEKVEVTYPDVFTGDKVVDYTGEELGDIELAYAMSIHKSQGSEFPVVITPVHQTQSRMLSRNLIYTAWTRAKDVLVVIGDKQELDKGIARVEGTERVSLVKEKLIKTIPIRETLEASF